MRPSKASVIYLDNNGTTQICEQSKKAMIGWLSSRSNPSADSVLARRARQMVEDAKKYILRHCGVRNYSVVFTSGASESNCLILKSVAESYFLQTNTIPHIITSATEHKSILQCCADLAEQRRAYITYISPNCYGMINPALVKRAIRPNTALISIMAANNEIGCINDIAAISKVAISAKVPFHTDAVQLFGKKKIPMKNIAAMSMSFHKLYGPMGIGMLLISKNLIKGYKLTGQIAGSQQNGMRGGTENIPAIAGVVASIQCTFTNRAKKNAYMCMLKKRLISGLEKKIPRGDYLDYFKTIPSRNEFVIIGPQHAGNCASMHALPNTLLLSFAKNDGKFCNTRLKKDLDKKRIVVSVGSACSTSDAKASHVLRAIRAPPVIKRGIIRISLSDSTTAREIDTAANAICLCVAHQF